MPLDKDGSSFYLIMPTKCKYFLYVLVALIAIVVYRAFTFFHHIPFNHSPDPFTTLRPLAYEYNTGKVILITGGNTGIGRQTAEILSLTGAQIVIGSRSLKRGEAAKDDILRSNKNLTDKALHIDVMPLDLSSIAAIDAFVTAFTAKYDALDILVCNAAINPLQDGLAFTAKYDALDILVCNAAINPLQDGLTTTDGLEAAFGINHIGHFYLVQQLMPQLLAHRDSRIIMVSAVPYLDASMNEQFAIDRLQEYKQWDAYIASKMANIMMTREFAKRYPSQANNGLKIVSLHPGVGVTDLFNHRDTDKDIIVPNNQILVSLFNVLFAYLGDSVEQLAFTHCYLALTDIKQIASGQHYINDKVQQVSGGVADNDTLCQQLWTKSERIIEDIRKKTIRS
eukprot:CAMPEP_0202732802 /NCGR_PEP_ID=MMETSP1385-20130828/187845_1 /ASSEMBLY_ACC=CAM_ASM_000861 /TAXON_ID=933848 /ORGANISM="Elphidium margaritaceum" /LENGTH=395 /DNA_ID=CAMNT_0049399125 /DNA_START=14 /DNA_END=1201 /DNA_ORIENTATION=+